MQRFTIGKLAQSAGVGVQTVRFYARKGLLKTPEKIGGFHYYSSEDRRKLRFIKNAQELGFTLKEIKDLLELRVKTQATCADVRKKADQKITEISEKMNTLSKIKKALEKLSSSCTRKTSSLSECPILDCFDDEENP